MPPLALTSCPFTATRDPLAALAFLAEHSATDYTLLHSAPPLGFSILAWDPFCQLIVDTTGTPTLFAPPSLDIAPPPASRNPLCTLQYVIDQIDFPAPHPLLGWLGFISYDIAPFLETIAPNRHRPRAAGGDNWPLLAFTLFHHTILFTPDSATLYTLGSESPPTIRWPDQLPSGSLVEIPPSPGQLLSQEPRRSFEEKIRRVQDYIAAGDIYQANLAQHWVLETRAAPHNIFRRLAAFSPAPYAAAMRFSQGAITRHVLSASPELFLAVDNGRAVTRPIKGTRPRDLLDPPRDAALRDQLLASEKDRAELTMIVDLLRNDLGRVSQFGSVQVTDPRALEQHPTIWHTVATIESRLRPDATLADILTALCPGGSITGAPKIRAMQIIEELESFPRRLYCGNIGVIGPRAKSLTLNIAIRTLLLQDHQAHLYAGAGIVADSSPAHEYEETIHKAAALFRALNFTLNSQA